MKKNGTFRRLMALALTLVMVLGLAVPAGAAEDNDNILQLDYQLADNDLVTAGLPLSTVEEPDEPEPYAQDEIVRVSIVLDEESTIEAGFSTTDIAKNRAAMAYRAELQNQQETVTEAIEDEVLMDRLDVVWNLTLAANIISANVAYGDIPAIEAVEGVAQVLIETRYEPMVIDSDEAADPNMATSSSQIGSAAAWASGYTGAGSRVAIIDTGLDIYHETFDEGAFEYSLQKQGYTGQLMVASDIDAVAQQLNAAVDAASAYRSAKVPYGYNYVDEDYNVEHIYDSQGDHGSHVAGIVAANAYVKAEDGYAASLSTVNMQGVAPDAQVLVMKVFGVSGGAYDADYMAAIEDAIVLGCDSVNLSLGSGNPGMSRSSEDEYQSILDCLAESDTVVVISAGNSSYWAENARNIGYLYSTDVSMQTDGAPGSYTNSLAVASVDNDGATGCYIQVEDEVIIYTETLEGSSKKYTNQPISTLAGDHEFVMIDGYGTAQDWAALEGAVQGKIAICSRGTSSFYEKAEAAVAAGAIATIVYNNQSGTISMDLSSYTKSAPCISITQSSAQLIRDNATAVTDDQGTVLYYTGTITVGAGSDIGTSQFGSEYYTMSSFSSWGVPGSLKLKPEITAPGGSIYSLAGTSSSHDQYQVMSGTSMAAPQVTGMAALVAQYIKEEGLAAKTGLSVRALTQSLLMSTAEPMIDGESGSYYPVIQQGAGLANVGAAISADTYIIMGEDTTESWSDGKVKAELGDDPQRTGEYSFSFTVNNLSDQAAAFDLSADLFIQAPFQYYASNNMSEDELAYYMDTSTTPIAANVTFAVDGKTLNSGLELGQLDINGDGYVNEADGQAILDYSTGAANDIVNYDLADMDSDGDIDSYDAYLFFLGLDNVLMVPASGSAKVEVTMTIPQNWKEIIDTYYENGTYIQGYVRADAIATGEGVNGADHSIPVLAFYGNWSDASMFDVGSYPQYATGEEYRIPYLGYMDANSYVVTYASDPDTAYYFGGNPLVADDTYMPQRNAMNNENGDMISRVQFTSIRNAAASGFAVVNKTTGETYVDRDLGEVNSAYYYTNGSTWRNTRWSLKTNFYGKDASEGDQLELTVTLVPEYYVDEQGNVDYAALGKGVEYSIPLVIDNTAPTMSQPVLDLENNTLTVTASDNQYVAAVALYNRSGTNLYAYTGAKQDIQPGESAEYVLDLSNVNGRRFLLQVCDYAMNTATYIIEEKIGGDPVLPDMIAYNMDEGYWTSLNRKSTADDLTKYAPSDHTFYGATIMDGYVFACDDLGCLYVMPQDDLMDVTTIGNMGVVLDDLAYNPQDETLYGIDDGQIYSIDHLTAEVTWEGDITDFFGLARHLAIDEDGYFYSVYGPSEDDDWGLGYSDIWRYTLESVQDGDVTGSVEYVADMSGGYFAPSSYQPSGFEVDPNTGNLIWLAHYKFNPNSSTTYSAIYEIKIGPWDMGEYKVYNQLWTHMTALVIPEKGASIGGTWDEAVDEVSGIQLDNSLLFLLRGTTKSLEAMIQPWTASDRNVTWTSDDESIATVDAYGRVTGLSIGTTTITATSVLDPSYSAECTVTVGALDVTLEGVIQNEDGDPMTFTWDLNDDTWTKTLDIDTSVVTAAKDLRNDQLYIQDATSSNAMHKMNAETGESDEISGACAFGGPIGGMANAYVTSENNDAPMMMGMYKNYLFIPCDAMANTFNQGWDLSSYLKYWTKATQFETLAYGGYAQLNDNYVDVFYAIDDMAYVWQLVYDGETGLSFYQIPSDLNAGFATEEGVQYSSMVMNHGDGCLYVSAFDGETSNIYQLTLNEDDEFFYSEYVGNVGEEVWPAVLTGAYVNSSDEPTAVTLVGEEMQTVQAEELEVFGSELYTSKSTGSLNSTASVTPDLGWVPGKVVVDVTAKDVLGNSVATHNGVFTAEYDSRILDLGYVSVYGDYISVNEQDGSVTFGYVDLSGFQPDEVVARMTFFYRDTARTSVTLTHEEVNDQDGPGYVEELKFTTEHLEHPNTDSSKPSSGSSKPSQLDKLLDSYVEETEPSISFSDVAEGSWYHDYVMDLVEAGVINGYPDGTFRPNGEVTWGEALKLVMKAVGYGNYEPVPGGHWASGFMAKALEDLLISSEVDLNAPITRAEMANLVANALKLAPSDNAYPFEDEAPEAAVALYAAGIITGSLDNGHLLFRADSTITRAEMAAIIWRVYNK